jgi:hypothetical protein
MKSGYNSNRVYRVRCKSGHMGYRTRLQNNYANFDEFRAYSIMFGIRGRLGFNSVKEAWDKNPIIEGSIEPSDLRVVA